MDAAPRAFADLPLDPELERPVPFACGTDDGYGGTSPSARSLDGRRVTQCALSRVCGACGAGLGRPIAFLGSELEVGRNAFHAPPLHLDCALSLRARAPGSELVTTGGFEFVRPLREHLDRRPTFSPNSLL